MSCKSLTIKPFKVLYTYRIRVGTFCLLDIHRFKVAYELSCRKAVELGIICDYKVLVTLFTTAEINDWLLKNGRVPIKPVNEGGYFVTAWDVANQLAIAKAYNEYGINLFSIDPVDVVETAMEIAALIIRRPFVSEQGPDRRVTIEVKDEVRSQRLKERSLLGSLKRLQPGLFR